MAALGTAATIADDQGTLDHPRFDTVVGAVVEALVNDPDDLVRSNAAHTLAQLARLDSMTNEQTLGSVVDALLGRLDPMVEPDNAASVALSRSTVRQSAAFALTQVLANHRLSEEHLDRIVDGPVGDRDRYIQGLVAEGLARTEHLGAASRRRLVRYLAGRRWSPSPAPLPEADSTTVGPT